MTEWPDKLFDLIFFPSRGSRSNGTKYAKVPQQIVNADIV